jgi:hypothetical protein
LRQDLYPRVYLPDFMTRARREFIDSAVFFDFFGGMAVVVGDGARFRAAWAAVVAECIRDC